MVVGGMEGRIRGGGVRNTVLHSTPVQALRITRIENAMYQQIPILKIPYENKVPYHGKSNILEEFRT